MSKHDRYILEENKRLRDENDRLKKKVAELEEAIQEDYEKHREWLRNTGQFPYGRNRD